MPPEGSAPESPPQFVRPTRPIPPPPDIDGNVQIIEPIPVSIALPSVKSGFRTTEFWLTFLLQIICFVMLGLIWHGDLTPSFEYAEESLLATALGGYSVYSMGRTKIKARMIKAQTKNGAPK